MVTSLGIPHHDLVAIAQKSFDLSTIRGCAKPAAASDSATPSFGWPELTVKTSATLPPYLSTRRISLSPARTSGHACIELIASAISNVSSAYGSLSTDP